MRIEDVVTPDVHCIELDAAGYPPGPSGLEQFRREINAAFPDESVYIADMRFVGADTVETSCTPAERILVHCWGREPTGRAVSFVIRTLNRFEGDRMAERWDRADFAGLLRQLE